jgi:tetratricopeptide (TPR) repeat protein
MESKRIRNRFRTGLVSLCFFLLPLIPSGAIEAEWKEQIVEGQRFTLKFITSFHGRQDVDIQDPAWPDGISKLSGPYTAQRTIQNEDGSFATVLQVIYTLRGDEPGIYTVPPVNVTDGLEIQTSDALVIPILDRDESFLNFPLLIEWLDIPESLYVGQSVPLVLMMHNLEEITLPDSVSIQPPQAAILESVRGLGEIHFSSMGERTLFHVPMETWMLTPSAPGTLNLGSAQVQILGLKRSTARQSISVKPLPERVSKTGAVGEFSYSLQLPDSEAVVGDTVLLKLRVEGVGNLNYMVLGEPEFPETLTVVRKEVSDFTAGNSGFEGYRELQYLITLDSEGAYNLEIPGFAWLNPLTGTVSVSPSKPLNLRVVSVIDSLNQKNQNFSLIPPSEVLKGNRSPLYSNPLAYLLLFPGVLFLIMHRHLKGRKKFTLSTLVLTLFMTGAALSSHHEISGLQESQSFFDRGEFKKALEFYKTAGAEWDQNANFLYNRGVLYYLSGENAPAIASLRASLYLKPTSSLIKNTLDSIEKGLSLEHQFELSLLLPMDGLFLLFVISVNLVFVVIALRRGRHDSTAALLIFLFTFSSLLFAGELIRSSWILSRKEAVVSQDVAIRKIPDLQGSPWIQLPEGTSVELVRNYHEFSLIHTAYGLEGWVLLEDLIHISKESYDDEL